MCFARPYFIRPILLSSLALKSVLRAVRLIADHDDVAALAEHLHRLAGLIRSELLDRGEEHAAGGLVAQHVLEVINLLRLTRLGAQRDGTGGKGFEHLAVQIVAVGHDHDCRVLQLRALAQQADVEQGDQALAAALREPHHAAFPILSLCGRLYGPLSGFSHAVVLVMPRDQFGGTLPYTISGSSSHEPEQFRGYSLEQRSLARNGCRLRTEGLGRRPRQVLRPGLGHRHASTRAC